MVNLTLSVVDKNGNVLSSVTGEDSITMLYKNEYEEGDSILLSASEKNLHIVWQVDDALGAAMCYMTKDVAYAIPFGEKKDVYSPKTFSGDKHYLFARVATEEEICRYRNLAINVADQHDVEGCYPHASANVETRGESVFAARNAIDGVHANCFHGRWPFQSWGINRDPKAEIKVDFGRTIWVDRITVYLRADFPHDSYWTEGTICFSDGSKEILKFIKTEKGQSFTIEPREIEWLTFGNLIKAEDESPFPALTQIEVYGKDVVKGSNGWA